MKVFFHKNTICLNLIVIGLVLLLSSCHSNYLNYKIDFSHNFAWKSDGSAFAFLGIKSLYRRPQGIATFPDGGKAVHEYHDVALYYYNIKDNKLNRVVDFNDLLRLYRDAGFYRMKMVFADSLLYYKLSKLYDSDIKRANEHVQTKEDSLKLSALIEKTNKTYTFNINTNKISEVDSATFDAALSQVKVDENLRKLAKEYLTKLSFADWGIILKDIYPQSKKTYIEYIVYMQGNSKVRDAVFEQIAPEFTKKEIQKMLKDMDAYKTKLDKKYKSSNSYKDHSHKLTYDEYYEPTRKRLQKFL